MVFKVFRNIPLPGRMRHPVHNKSLKQRMRDEVPEGAEQFHVAWVRNAPHARICVLQMEAVADGEAVLGGFKGVLATQVGSSIGSPQTVRVVFDENQTSLEEISKQTGFEIVDEDGTRPFVLAPPDQQKYHLQQTPIANMITELPKGGKVYNSPLFAARLNAYCNGYGSEENLQQDCAYLTENHCSYLMNVWKEKRKE
jgi:hypothetical protein|eukprot:CAMPEP_0174280692 /NCGR_PEP_ID=MMETSP0809-20121228/995_1 /TAXON_ID=73025 ORGANISM="Eutreptiella gymnastica-like, Strain CCMP1594" /NCGR_SAMPLE_ID=MMETSP0809 /ASSEMBLY_ACC=CAM_ASM_000658 /LENGTH=197 /DNA_ID=CAMNT_0015373745 /DNA_START=19 /DNA_END=612 /DNA_ORIENTATION=-